MVVSPSVAAHRELEGGREGWREEGREGKREREQWKGGGCVDTEDRGPGLGMRRTDSEAGSNLGSTTL